MNICSCLESPALTLRLSFPRRPLLCRTRPNPGDARLVTQAAGGVCCKHDPAAGQEAGWALAGPNARFQSREGYVLGTDLSGPY